MTVEIGRKQEVNVFVFSRLSKALKMFTVLRSVLLELVTEDGQKSGRQEDYLAS